MPGLEVLAVSSCGVNYADTHAAENSYLSAQALPFVPGAEVVGTLADVNVWVTYFVLACETGSDGDNVIEGGAGADRLPNTLSIRFPGGDGGPAGTTTFTNVAVTPGTSYSIVVPSGGSVTLQYYA